MNAIERITSELSTYAGERVNVEMIGGNLYAFGSEIAVLRIFAKYHANGAIHNPKARIGYSDNMKTHYFTLSDDATPSEQ